MADLKEITAFLLGEAPLEGVWFGGKHPTRRGEFWWRSLLREAVAGAAHQVHSREAKSSPRNEA